jgi:hypothetical protein
MVNPRDSVGGQSILGPHDASRLARACPDLENWPRSWHVVPEDLAVGEQIVQALTPFLLDLLDQGLARKTLSRHRDNLWSLGGELIRRRHEDAHHARMDVNHLLEHLIEDDGGPLMWPRITEAEQDSLDATCRKLHQFLHRSTAAG